MAYRVQIDSPGSKRGGLRKKELESDRTRSEGLTQTGVERP